MGKQEVQTGLSVDNGAGENKTLAERNETLKSFNQYQRCGVTSSFWKMYYV